MDEPGSGWVRKTVGKKRVEAEQSAQRVEWYCLCCSTDLPRWQFKHRGLKSGYRTCPSFSSAALSLFYWHNESVNMWSHYLCSVGLIAYAVYTWCDSERNAALAEATALPALQSIPLLLATTLLANVFPILASAFCHQFYLINPSWHQFCWFLDFLGILTGMMSVGVGFVYLSFYCHPTAMHALLYGMLVCYILAIQITWRRFKRRTSKRDLVPADRFPEFSQVLSSFGWIATLIPVASVVAFLPEYQTDPFSLLLLQKVCAPVVMGLGIVCFAQGNFPERFAARWGLPESFFDIVGHSHQWWHLVSGALQFWWVYLLRAHFEARMAHACLA
mmetsp:Transcript_12073/g.26889  ORF Transcript_12073/g.26889 Transcript_12073/m.26889 type:complete len:332 (+) Transcript_12073:73-1068(+)